MTRILAMFGRYDYYFNVTDHMVSLEDNIVFEIEVLSDQFELGAISVHLFQGTIPLNRVTQVRLLSPSPAFSQLLLPSLAFSHDPSQSRDAARILNPRRPHLQHRDSVNRATSWRVLSLD